ncbi:MAG: hypothetical protein HYW25_04665 [Candidatus Aenigmarchaeota archaeon]|nr:hypothetical protein [Candidatus Aenigmarchaeota archaeon]
MGMKGFLSGALIAALAGGFVAEQLPGYRGHHAKWLQNRAGIVKEAAKEVLGVAETGGISTDERAILDNLKGRASSYDRRAQATENSYLRMVLDHIAHPVQGFDSVTDYRPTIFPSDSGERKAAGWGAALGAGLYAVGFARRRLRS